MKPTSPLFPPRVSSLAVTASLLAVLVGGWGRAQEPRVAWKDALKQEAGWHKTTEAARIADNLLVYQHDNGGWDKNIDMAEPLDAATRAPVIAQSHVNEATLDNGATHTQLVYLARVYDATQAPRYRAAWEKGFDYLLAAQYPNGGWPQYYPLRKGYYTHITYNDDAMVGVLNLLRAVSDRQPGYTWVDATRRAQAVQAVQKGIAMSSENADCRKREADGLVPAARRKNACPRARPRV